MRLPKNPAAPHCFIPGGIIVFLSCVLIACGPAVKGPMLVELEARFASPNAAKASEDASSLFNEARERLDRAVRFQEDGDEETSEREARIGLVILQSAIAEMRMAEAQERWEKAEATRVEALEDFRRYESMRAEAEEALYRAMYAAQARRVIEAEKARAISDETMRERGLPKDEKARLAWARRVISREVVTQMELRINALGPRIEGAGSKDRDAALTEARDWLAKAREAVSEENHDLVFEHGEKGLAILERLLSDIRKNGGAKLEAAEACLATGLVDAGGQVTRESRGLVVTVPGLFGHDRSRADTRRLGALAKVGEFLSKHPGIEVNLECFAGSPAAPDRGEKRAESWCEQASRTLVASGLDAGRIHVFAPGPAHPIAPYHTRLGNQKNDRVEIVVLLPLDFALESQTR